MEGNPLWKKIICSIYMLEPGTSLMDQQSSSNIGGLWSAIMKVDSWNDKIKRVLKQGWWMRIGDGRKIKFLKDKWLGDIPLKDKFPRLYLISLQREETIANMGFGMGSKVLQWQWNLTWRRFLFQWEIQ